jgi:RNA polymerase sigma factor (sigma-70 family)
MADSETTRQSLLCRMQDGQDREAWNQFVEIYSPFVFGILRRRGLQDADAADVMQEVMRTVFRSFQKFDHNQRPGAFRRWLACIVQTRLCDYVERRKKETPGSGDTALLKLLDHQLSREDEEASVVQEYQKALFQWAVGQVRGEFHDGTWQAFWQTYVEGRASKEVADTLGLSVEAVYMARSRILARLKKKIGEVEDET